MASQVLRANTVRTPPYRLLDAWRGIAVLWVLMIHSCVPMIAGQSPGLARVPLYAFSLWGQLGVTMFFVISGYCITAAVDSALRKPNSVVVFLKARVRRIYPPYFASLVVAVLFTLFVGFLASHHVIPKVNHTMPFLGEPFLFYVANLTLTQVPLHMKSVIVVYWSLCYEMTFYVLVAICLGLLARKSKTAFYSGLNVLTLISLAWLIVSQQTCPFPMDLWYQFGLGGLVFMLITNPRERITQAFFGLTIALTLLFALLHQGPHSFAHPSTRIQAVFCTAFVFTLLGLYRFDAALTRNRAVKALEWLGTISYSLYLSHRFIIAIPEQIGKKLGLVEGLFWINFLVQIAVAIVFAYGFHILFERPFLSSRAKIREAEIVAVKAPDKDGNREDVSEKAMAIP